MSEKEIFEVESGETSLRLALFKHLQYWYIYLFGMVICFGLAFLYLHYSTPVYNISSTILIKGNEKEGSSENAVLNDLENFKAAGTIDDEVDILKSRDLMLRVLKALSLDISYYEEENIKNKELYGKELPLKIIFSDFDSARYRREGTIKLHIRKDSIFELEEANGSITIHTLGQEIRKPFGLFKVVPGPVYSEFINRSIGISFYDVNRLADYYSENLSVEIANKTNKEAKILNINLAESVPEKGRNIINKLIELYNNDAIEDKNLVATNTIQFIDERLEYLISELSEVERKVEIYKRHNHVTDINSEASMYIENNSDYEKQLSKIEIELEVLESIEKYLNKGTENNGHSMVPSTLSIQDPTLLNLISKYNELQLERERMLRAALPNNPLVKNINEQLNNIKQNILEIISNTKDELKIARRNMQMTSRKLASRIQKVPLMERELLEVKRQQGIKQELYLYLLQKREESTLSLAATTVSSARVIDPARAGALPVSPKKKSVFMLAFLLGFGLPFALLYFRNIFKDQVQQQSDVQKATATPILGEIPHRETNEILVISEESSTPIAELFRLIRTNFQYETAEKEIKVILVTSSMSGEGKTFFSINFGASLAMTGKKVVVLDCDLRNPSLLQDLGLSNGLGIIDYITSGDTSVDETIKPSPLIPNLFVVGSGPIPRNPAELMMSPKLSQYLAELKKKFDYIILDTAPVGQVADAFSLNAYTDLMIFLIRYNYTNNNQINIINDIYANKKFNNPMIVMNDANKSNSYHYGYGYSEITDKKKKKNLALN